jgi:hypothetical protein
MLVLENIVDKFGDLKDIFEKTGTALFGLSEETVEAGVRIGDLAEKGASLGAVFGPLGAAIGLVAGGVLGYFVEKINESNRIAEEAAERLALYKSRVDALTAASHAAASQEELNKAIEQGRLAAETNTNAVKILADAQAVAQKQYDQTSAKIEAQREELARLQQVRLDELSYYDQSLVQSRMNVLTYETQQAGTAKLSDAKQQLTTVTKALTIAEAEQARVAQQLAKAQALQAVDTLDAAYQIQGQLLAITEGSKFAGQSTKSLQQEYDKLKQSLDAAGREMESLALTNITLGDETLDAASAAQAQIENEQKAQGVLEASKVQLARLAELQGELNSRKQTSVGVGKAATAAVATQTKAVAAQVTEYDKLVALEKDHEDFLKRQRQSAAESLFGMDYLRSAEQASQETLDLLEMLDRDGQSLDEQVQGKIDALRKLRQDTAKELADQARAQSLKDVAAAELAAAEATTKGYIDVLQPYADFVGGLFGTFSQALASGQSATEAFAESAKQAIAGVLSALAKEFGAKSLAALAGGFAALTNPLTAATAPGFFKSAALYAAAAAAAGAGSAFVSASGGGAAVPSVGGGAAATAGGVGGTGNSLGGSSQQSNATPGSIVVDLRGAVFPTNDLTGAQQFGEAVARSLAAASAGNQPMARRLIGTRGFVV